MKDTQNASLWADKAAPERDPLEGVECALSEMPKAEPSTAANEQRAMFRETELSDLATYIVR